MKTFTDTQGRSWSIVLNLGTAIRVKSELHVDLLQPEAGDPPLLTRLGTDEILLGEIICCLLQKQFETHDMDAEDVLASFDGTTLLAAQKAFYEELVDFFQSRGRTDRARAVQAQMKVIEKAVAAVESRIDQMDLEKLVDGAMSGEFPDLSESIPED